jgi:hypothetical protein
VVEELVVEELVVEELVVEELVVEELVVEELVVEELPAAPPVPPPPVPVVLPLLVEVPAPLELELAPELELPPEPEVEWPPPQASREREKSVGTRIVFAGVMGAAAWQGACPCRSARAGAREAVLPAVLLAPLRADKVCAPRRSLRTPGARPYVERFMRSRGTGMTFVALLAASALGFAGCLLTSSFDGLQGGTTMGMGGSSSSSASSSGAGSTTSTTIATTTTSGSGGVITPKAPQVGVVTATAGTPVNLQAPPNVSPGDMLVMVIDVQPDPGVGAIAAPPGWTALGDASYQSCGNFRDFYFWHAAGPSEASTYAITSPESADLDYAIVVYAGVSPTSPSGTPGPLMGNTTDQSTATWTAPAGMTQRVPSHVLGIFDELEPSVGLSADKVIGVQSGGGGCGTELFVALEPG